MIKINFYPESDLGDYTEGVKQYEKIWKDEGENICNKWEEVTGLKFRETEINATVSDLRGLSHPLNFHYDRHPNQQLSTMVHEIGHRMLYKRVKGMGRASSLAHHQYLDLVLFDVLLELYGQDFLNGTIAWDSNLRADNPQLNYYKDAWDWALQYKTKEERQGVFKKILSGELKLV